MYAASVVFFSILTIIAPIFGRYIAFVYRESSNKYAVIGAKFITLLIKANKQQNWRQYFLSLMSFNLTCIIFTFLIIYYQQYLPLNQNLQHNLGFAASLNAAVSFATGTFWQSHNPETELSIFSQVFALMMQNFLAGGTTIAVFIAFTRGITNNKSPYIGNFYYDFIKAIVFILFPVSLVFALFLISQAMPHSFIGAMHYIDLSDQLQELFIGPVAGQVAIRNIAANGGSLLQAAAAHPFESPSRSVIILSLYSVLLLPVSLIFTYGYLIKQPKLSWSLYIVITCFMVISLLLLELGETSYGIPFVIQEKVMHGIGIINNFNYTGKELIYDQFPSLMWTLLTTMGSSGSPNACLENYAPLSTLVMFSNLIVSKFVLEGVSSGFFAMLVYLIAAVFVKGLATNNTSNFFGKKITANEINYVITTFLLMPVGVLVFTSITLLTPSGREVIIYDGPQAITDIAYNFVSTFSNNGSILSGIFIRNDYFNYATALAMFIGRYFIIYYSLALGGSFAAKKRISNDVTEQNRFSFEISIFLIIIALLVGAITFVPLIILGPLMEVIIGH